MLGFVQAGVGLQKLVGRLLGGVQGAGVRGKVGNLQGGQAMLAAAEEIAGATVVQVVLGHLKAVGGVAQKTKPVPHGLAFVVADEDAHGLTAAPAHPATQLVQG